jgi:hypothetical protein
MQKTLQELANFMMQGTSPHPRPPSFLRSLQQPSPPIQSLNSPTSSTPPADQQVGGKRPLIRPSLSSCTVHLPSMSDLNAEPSVPRQARDSMTPSYHGAVASSSQLSSQTNPNQDTRYAISNQSASGSSHQQALPPFSAIGAYPAHQSSASSARYFPDHGPSQRRPIRHQDYNPSSSSRRSVRSSSNIGSQDSSDYDDSDGLPATGLIAPWETLRGIAERVDQVCLVSNYCVPIVLRKAYLQDVGESGESHGRTRSPSPARAHKKRKTRHGATRNLYDSELSVFSAGNLSSG